MVVPLLIAIVILTLIYSLNWDDSGQNTSRDVPQTAGNYAAER